MKTTPTASARAAVLAALAIWALIALLPPRRPEPFPRDATPTEFAAARAMEHVAAIAQNPHPVGSAENTRVREYIRAELAARGLASEVQTGVGEYRRRGRHISATVTNVIARLPGTANTRPVMLAAHYDSVPRGPGAGDDAHGVAVLLETLRALGGGPPLRNDVIFLFTDGEEMGLLGADVFMREHPWRGEPGIVLNFEARGTGGVATMFETSEGNAWMINALRQAVPDAAATSLAYEIYRKMPNDTDLSVFKRGGLAGMNFAFIGNPHQYHQPSDNPANLDRRSVQEQGRYALSLVRRFGGQDLRSVQSRDAVYFPTGLTPLVVYPSSWVMPLGWIGLAGLAASTAVAFRKRIRGKWLAIPLMVLALLQFLVARPAPGASYILEWPLLAGVAAFAAIVTAPPVLAFGWRIVLMALCPAAAMLLIAPLFSMMITALGGRQAAPVLVALTVAILISVSPQLVLAFRRTQPAPALEASSNVE